MSSERVEIGKVCYKGLHVALNGETDYGVCGSHYYATVYVTVEVDRPNPRGEEIALAAVAEEIRRRVEVADRE